MEIKDEHKCYIWKLFFISNDTQDYENNHESLNKITHNILVRFKDHIHAKN